MAETQNLTQEQTLSLRLLPQQLRYARLLEMNAAELDDAVERELEANPALEEVDPPVALSSEGESASAPLLRRHMPRDDDGPGFTLPAEGATLYEQLDEQLGELPLSPELLASARYIVASLDTNGYLRRDVDVLADDMLLNHGLQVSLSTVREALRIVQSLDPPGIGASSLQEALLLQLERMAGSETRDDAIRILREDFDAFSKKHIRKLTSSLGISRERVADAIDMILGLNPKPGASVGEDGGATAAAIVPDVVMERDENGGLSISLNNRFPELAVQSSFSQAVAEMESSSKKRKERDGEREYILTNYNDARDFIRILSRRQQTLLEVMAAIMKIQKDYFETEDVYALRPMMLKDIGAMTGLDLSVISRATSGKYLETPWGIFPLRFFFSDAKGEEQSGGERATLPAKAHEVDSEDVTLAEDEARTEDDRYDGDKVLTNRMIEAIIRKLVDGEDKHRPLSDEKLHRAMQREGYELSRRAITKYRDRMGIPVARLRKEF